MIAISIRNELEKIIGTPTFHVRSVGGGSINQTFCIETNDQSFFCKINEAGKFPRMFEKEKNGLQLISKQKLIKTPGVIYCDVIEHQQVLVLEWIRSGTKTAAFWKRFGQQVAELHQVTNEFFGLDESNYMGSVEQLNEQGKDWNTFFSRQRLQPLVQKCIPLKLLTATHQQQFETIFKRLPDIFDTEKPALLHGDLWSGNFMCGENSNPVLIDTAVYFGHRSMDLGMTTLFGGFHRDFYESYHYHYPLPKNHNEQWEVCNLYPLLIHLLLFGKSYLSQIESTLKSYQ